MVVITIFANLKEKFVEYNGQKIIPGEQLKPSGSLGYYELRDTPKAGLHIVRLSSGGKFQWAFRFHKTGKYTLGPSFGKPFREPEEEKDPIIKVLLENGISPKCIAYSDTFHVELTPLWRRGCYFFYNGELVIDQLGGWKEDKGVEESYFIPDNGGGINYFKRKSVYSNGLAAIICSARHKTGTDQSYQLSKIIVNPTANNAEVAIFLKEKMGGLSLEERFVSEFTKKFPIRQLREADKYGTQKIMALSPKKMAYILEMFKFEIEQDSRPGSHYNHYSLIRFVKEHGYNRKDFGRMKEYQLIWECKMFICEILNLDPKKVPLDFEDYEYNKLCEHNLLENLNEGKTNTMRIRSLWDIYLA